MNFTSQIIYRFDSGASAREARRDAPYLRKIGNSSSRENLVMTAAYERPSELANAVRTDSGGVGGASRGKAHGGPEECYIFSRRDFSEKRLIVFVMSTNVLGR